MVSGLTNHLWQSTLFAVAMGLLAAMFRRNRAQVRYWMWFSASAKFLVPFALLMSFGSHTRLAPAARLLVATPAVASTIVATAMVEIAEPFPEPVRTAAPNRGAWVLVALFAGWACGVVWIAWIRLRGWLRIRAAIGASNRIRISAPVEVRSSPGLLEPGVVGIFRSVLLLPDGIERHLTRDQLEAVLTHELCHVRRRDNLTSAVHMLVEALFWFHPLVWWIGARLVEERERACDEEVLRLGSEPRVYAEGILNVCKLYVESPLACVSGVTGSDIKKRIEGIMTNRIAVKLNAAKKIAIAAAGVAALSLPVVVGIMNAPVARAQQAAPPLPPAAIASTPQMVAQAAAPVTGGRGGPAALQPAPPPDDEQARRKAQVEARLGPVQSASPKGRILIKYGMPDELGKGAGTDPTQVWTYNHLEDFHSNVEFEFAPGRPVHINYPPPVTFEGQPGVAPDLLQGFSAALLRRGEPAATNIIAGLPGRHASMQIYPAKEFRTLSVPLDSLSDPVDILGQFVMRSDTGARGSVVANIQDHFQWTNLSGGGTYTASFTLDSGSYVCGVIVWEPVTKRLYGETINFDVQ